MKTCVVIGSQGQDGRLLSEFLSARGDRVIGVTRKDPFQIQADEIYYLAAYHNSSEDKPPEDVEVFIKSMETHAFKLFDILEALKRTKTRLFYASSSLAYGSETLYGISKKVGSSLCQYYRQKYGLFASTGILFNHESHYRKDTFLSRKIILAAVHKRPLVVGNLSAVVDWGYAPDYVKAMARVMELDVPGDFEIATGVGHTVQEFVEIAFGLCGLDWKEYVTENKGILARSNNRVGSPSVPGWKPSVDFNEMIRLLIEREKNDSSTLLAMSNG